MDLVLLVVIDIVTGNLHVRSIFHFHFSLQIVAHNLVKCPWWVTTPNVLVVVGVHVNILVSGQINSWIFIHQQMFFN